MARIGVFVKNLTSGGAEKQAVILARSLADRHEVTFMVFNSDMIHKKYRKLLGTKAGFKAFSGSLRERFAELRRYCMAERFDIIFSYLTAANLFAALATRGLPTVVIAGLRNSHLPLPKHIADAITCNHLVKGAVANCYSGKAHFSSRGFRGERISVIHNCIDPIHPYHPKRTRPTVEVITVGRFVAQKDYRTAIRAVALAAKNAPQLRFTIIGYGELEGKIREWVSHYGIADITHIVLNPPDIDNYLNHADIYLSTSLYEGLSNSILEGINADLPVVATDVGDNSYLVTDGVTGALTPARDYRALAAAIGKLAADERLRADMGRKGKEKLYSDFSVERFTRVYNDYIDSLL